MPTQTVFFYLFSAVLLFAALRVVTSRNPVHAVLYLMLSFSQAAAIWLLLAAEFLAITLVLVYLGAVMVLFLFVVMMLDIRIDRLRQGFWKHMPLAALLGFVVIGEMAAVLIAGYGPIEQAHAMEAVAAAGGSNSKALGQLLYTQYVWPVQIAAVILLVAMIAAIALTLRGRKESKFVDPSRQVHVRAADRLQMVKLEPAKLAEPPAPPAPPEGQAASEEKKA